MKTICSISGCENPAKCKGWCGKHYQRWWKNGDPLIARRGDNGNGCIISPNPKKPEYKIRLISVVCPFRGKRVQLAEHIWVAEQFILKRRLAQNETVHHVDYNPLNNSIDNLQVMTRSEHVRLHRNLEAAGIRPRKSRHSASPPAA